GCIECCHEPSSATPPPDLNSLPKSSQQRVGALLVPANDENGGHTLVWRDSMDGPRPDGPRSHARCCSATLNLPPVPAKASVKFRRGRGEHGKAHGGRTR